VRSCNVFADGDRLYSYGYHFVLATALRDKRGNVSGYLLNGDRYSSTTNRHQADVRNAVARTGVPSVIVPYAALSSAGVSGLSTGTCSVEIVDVLPDRSEHKRHSSATLPDGATAIHLPVWESVPMSDDEITAVLDMCYKRKHGEWTRDRKAIDDAHGRLERKESRYVSTDEWQAARPIGAEPMRADVTVESETVCYGGSSAYFGSAWTTFVDGRPTKRAKTGTVERYGFGLRRASKLYGTEDHGWRFTGPELKRQDDGSYTWDTYRHWLGESLIRATVDTSETRKCRPCRGTGRAEGPATADRVETRTGWRAGGTYVIPGNVPSCSECGGRGSHTHYGTRRVTLLSGFDHNERRASYFLCELPRAARNVTSVSDAYESLKPEAVRVAESVGRDVSRQGDIFAIAVPSVTTRDLTRQGGKLERRGTLLRTNHVGTDVVVTPDGVTYARGCLTHAPERRRPDHARIKLSDGRTWYVIVKNTVPLGK
jgi:hypothetical protein